MTPEQQRLQEHRAMLWITAITVLLVAMTLRLWGIPKNFPVIPLWAIDVKAYGVWELVLRYAALAGLALLFLIDVRRRNVGRAAALVTAVCGWGLVVFDQHRLQPWWHFSLLALLVFALSERAEFALRRLRWLIVSVYFFSAVSKLDASFVLQHGQVMLHSLFGTVGLDFMDWPERLRQAFALAIPVGELLVALGLLFPATRKVAMVAAIAMHVGLLLILGPLGLGHRPPVLAWNVMFIVLLVLLFRQPKPAATPSNEPAATAPESPPRGRGRFGDVLIGLILLLPVLEWVNIYDHWPGWALYASRPEYVRVDVHVDAAENLSLPLRDYLAEPEPLAEWQTLRIDRWSLDAVGAPIYPENRFAWGTAYAVAREFDLGEQIRVTEFGPADRWTGDRDEISATGIDDIAAQVERFELNALVADELIAEEED